MDTTYKQLSSGLLVPGYIEEETSRIDPGLIGAYIRHLRRDTELAASTIEKYSHDIGAFSAWLGESILSKHKVKRWTEEKLRESRASTVNIAISALNGFFRWLSRDDCLMKFYRVQESPYREDERNLTEEEYRRLLDSADGRMKALLTAFRGTGIRVSELKFFTAEGVREGRITVRNKGKIREVFLDPNTRRALLDYCSREGIESGVIFRNRQGGALHRNSIWQSMKRLAKKAGVALTKVFPHNLRHLFAVERYRTDKDIEGLRLDMGHSLIATTQRYLRRTLTEHWERIRADGSPAPEEHKKRSAHGTDVQNADSERTKQR